MRAHFWKYATCKRKALLGIWEGFRYLCSAIEGYPVNVYPENSTTSGKSLKMIRGRGCELTDTDRADVSDYIMVS